MIEVKDLHIRFDEKVVLNGVGLRLHKGENLGIIGKSGVGKSVLAKCIVRLLEPDNGEIFVMGKDILKMNAKDLNQTRKEIGYLFQGGALYDSMNVKENLAFPIRRTQMASDKNEVNYRIEVALRSVGLLDAMYKMPSELSGGMKKRIGLARALILRPKIMLYDEPTTGLDTVTSNEISELIVKVQEEYNTSSIIITHDMKCARIATNRIMALVDGKIKANGSYDELENSADNDVNIFFK